MRRLILCLLVALFLFSSQQPAYAISVRGVQKTWKEKVVAPFIKPMVQKTSPAMRWSSLSTEEKKQKLPIAKDTIVKTVQKADGVLQRFERHPRYAQTAAQIRQTLNEKKDEMMEAKTPEEFEGAVHAIQEVWSQGKSKLRSLL